MFDREQSRFRLFENEAESKRSDLYGPRGTGRERCLIIEQGCRDDRGQEGKGDKFFFSFSSRFIAEAVVTVGAKNGQLPNERQLSGDQLQERPVQRIKCNRPMSTVHHLCPFLLLSFFLPALLHSFPFLFPSTSATRTPILFVRICVLARERARSRDRRRYGKSSRNERERSGRRGGEGREEDARARTHTCVVSFSFRSSRLVNVSRQSGTGNWRTSRNRRLGSL